MTRQYYVYILANKKHGTLYIGVTSDLIKRVYEHKHKLVPGFTEKYDIALLGYYEVHQEIDRALQREKKSQTLDKELENKIDREP